mmetsp:Transcript_6079/g.5426  ORF Transcript_6079/g.5426 Transcript_6079/m.5426 type:complete len:88 (+) Transcript_6079:747-1010(+)
MMISKLIHEAGLSWSEIAKRMNIADPTKVKNRYYSFIRKKGLLEKLYKESKTIKWEEASMTPNHQDYSETKEAMSSPSHKDFPISKR